MQHKGEQAVPFLAIAAWLVSCKGENSLPLLAADHDVSLLHNPAAKGNCSLGNFVATSQQPLNGF